MNTDKEWGTPLQRARHKALKNAGFMPCDDVFDAVTKRYVFGYRKLITKDGMIVADVYSANMQRDEDFDHVIILVHNRTDAKGVAHICDFECLDL